MKHSTHLSLKDVTALLQLKAHRIEYALANGLVAEPQLRIGLRRIFTPADVRRLAAHFNVELPVEETIAEPAGA
jgi:DNA-binding transcriptional MerR regulator